MELRGPPKALGGVVTKRLEVHSLHEAGIALRTRPAVKKTCVCLTVYTAYVASSVKTFNDRVIPRSSVSLERAVCLGAGVAPKSDGALSVNC